MAKKPFAFVVMPFREDFNEVYEASIKQACKAVEVYCERVDEEMYQAQFSSVYTTRSQKRT